MLTTVYVRILKSLCVFQAEQIFLQYTTIHFYVRGNEDRIVMN